MKLNFTQQGRHQPVILIHGLFGSLSNLGLLARALREKYCVYLIDLRNHGDSPHADCMDYTSMAADVIELMDSQGLQSASIIGHSMGGKVAMQIALNYPSRIDRLIVVDISPVSYPNRHQNELTGLNALSDASITSRKQADEILSYHVPEVDIRSFLLKNLIKSESGEFVLKINLPGIRKNYCNIAGAPSGEIFNGPTLFAKGGNSEYISAEHKKRVLELFPKAQLKVIDKAGHWLHAEKPVIFRRITIRFLSSRV